MKGEARMRSVARHARLVASGGRDAGIIGGHAAGADGSGDIAGRVVCRTLREASWPGPLRRRADPDLGLSPNRRSRPA